MLGGLRQAALQWPLLGSFLTALVPSAFDTDPATACTTLININGPEDPFAALNATITSASYLRNATSGLETLGVCAKTADTSVALCRVQFAVDTSSTSRITGEAWLPTNWTGRSLALGNGGLGGCIDYANLDYGTSLGFATIATNNGHDGNTGESFVDKEVLADYTSRSIHVAADVHKALMDSYYSKHARRSYYLGCSTGGRQGIYSAIHYLNDFDGILAGAPATNILSLLGWTAKITLLAGAPDGEASPKYISSTLWDVIGKEIMDQCDALDGVKDGVITEPDACEFRPEELLCRKGRNKAGECLSQTQVESLKAMYSPFHGRNGEWIFPRLDPGSEANEGKMVCNGQPFSFTLDWMKYVIGAPDFNYSTFGFEDIERMRADDPGKVSTFDGDLSVFRERGGKIISYHGRADGLIPSGNAKALYNVVSLTLGLGAKQMDDFYRLFLVPGMSHCVGGSGSPDFGQHARAIAPASSGASNILLDLVNWVEHGKAPDVVTGASKDGTVLRDHCRYPQKSKWDGKVWVCVV